MKCLKIIYFLFQMLPIIEICLNYNETDFLEYHEKRIKFNVCNLLILFIQILLPLFAICGPVCVCLLIILIVILFISGFYYGISSFYLYFAYDGSKRIKSRAIKIMMWISIINFILGIFSNCNSSHSSASATDSEDKESDFIEMKEEQTI